MIRSLFVWVAIALIFPTLASAASITVLVQTNTDKPMNGVPITCWTKKPTPPGAMPTPPIITKMTTNSSGIISYSPETGDNYSYSCNVSYTITPDSCYNFSGINTGTFALGSGDSRSFTLKGQYLVDTCGTKVPQSEAEALANPYGTQRIDPIWGDKPKVVATPKPSPTPSPSSSPDTTMDPSPTPTVIEPEPSQKPTVIQSITTFLSKIWSSLFHPKPKL